VKKRIKRLWLKLPERKRVAGATVIVVSAIDALVVALVRPPEDQLVILLITIWLVPLTLTVSYTLFWPLPTPVKTKELHKLPRWQKIAILGAVVVAVIAAYGLMFWGLAVIIAAYWREIAQAVTVVIGGAVLLNLFLARR